jgi:hypothetical protein
MPTGLIIKHAPDSRGFWYPCDRSQIKQVLASHLILWGRYHAVENGETVVKTVDPKTLLCSFCSNRTAAQSGDTYTDPETVDPVATLA